MSAKQLTRLTDAQSGGAQPRENAWLAASAGTGKTQVLTARVLQLLLDGAAPAAILCLTFTKAGASEMARRIRERLATWVQMSDAELKIDLWAIHMRGHDNPAVWQRARTLFARVIDAPGGGLAIQTIHSFCQSLLSSFPEEAALAPGFRALDEREMAQLQRETLGDLVESAGRTGHLGFLDRLQALSLAHGEDKATAYIYRCAGAMDALDALPAMIGPWLRERLGLPQSDPKTWMIAACEDAKIDMRGLAEVAQANSDWKTPTGDKRAFAIRTWLAASMEERAASIGDVLKTLIKQDNDLLADYGSREALKPIKDLAQRCADQLMHIRDIAAHMVASDRLADGLDAGRHFARAFAERKRREGLVDFDDLIERAAALLTVDGRAEWIRYKLDSRIDHILVDEAQDTNAAQWSIIEALSAEFFAGEGARAEAMRTMFVVGDFKQAIYGFQGTNPASFAAARHAFAQMGDAAERPFLPLSIDTNFRSSPPVLRVVDALVDHIGPAALGLDQQVVRHTAFADSAPGKVVLWPPIAGDSSGRDEDRDEDSWIDSATAKVANGIAQTVRGWLEHGLDGKPVRASDVMILVRKRAELAGLIVARLQAHGVPVAGVDRLRLQTPVVVQDLLAAARFAVQPLDDLNLACLLTSPIIGWSHDELIERARRPSAVNLWPHLREMAAVQPLLEPLYALLRMGGFVTPYRFFETLLSGPMAGRARLIGRLGNAARDPIEELVTQALAYEAREGASLHGFLRWFDAGVIEIKREMDSDADEVRVMTVHGAKGLQSRIVILADATVDPARKQASGIALPTENGAVPLTAISKDKMPDILSILLERKNEAELEEHWRLLYVAMTRAERMLFVVGGLNAHGKLPDNCWHDAVEQALTNLGAQWEDAKPEDGASPWPSALTYAVGGSEAAGRGAMAAIPHAAMPEWALVPPAEEVRPARPLAPSAMGEVEAQSVPAPPPSAAMARAAERGTLMHALFERLPGVEPESRHQMAMTWLERMAPDFEAHDRSDMVAAVLRVLDDTAFAPLFGPDSLAEVPFSALVDGRVIAGSIDRLLVGETVVRVIDFKTGAHVPDGEAAVPIGYLRQMGAYAAALAVIFPGRTIEAALLFTGGPRLIALSDAMIAAHKPDFAEGKAKLAAAS